MREENHEKLVQNELPKFPFSYIKKIKKFRRWQDAQLSLLGSLLLFRSIKQIFDVEFSPRSILYNDYGKPYFKGNPIHFSISHSGEIAVCAITANCEIGIDIEKISNINIDNFKDTIDPNDWFKIISSPQPQTEFYDYWTKKEAAIKAHGFGQSNDFTLSNISDHLSTITADSLYFKEIKIDNNYKCTIASKTDLAFILKNVTY